MAKKDARFLSPDAQAATRRRVLNALREGMTHVQAAEAFGVSRWSVSRWVKAHKVAGEQTLVAKRRGRRPGEAGKLSANQSACLRSLLVENLPEQRRLSFHLWTRAAVSQLIQRECGVCLSMTAVGEYLKRWGMSAQHPVKQVYEHNDEAIARWLDEVYPKIASRARRERVRLYWSNVAGVRSEDIRGRRVAPACSVAIGAVSTNHVGLSLISALTNKGERSFMVCEGRIQAEQFIGFCERLIKQSSAKVFLILDRRPVCRWQAVQDWLRTRGHQIELFNLPGGFREGDPDALFNGDINHAIKKIRLV